MSGLWVVGIRALLGTEVSAVSLHRVSGLEPGARESGFAGRAVSVAGLKRTNLMHKDLRAYYLTHLTRVVCV